MQLRIFASWILVAAAGFGGCAAPAPTSRADSASKSPAFRWHFVGGNRLTTDGSVPAWVSIGRAEGSGLVAGLLSTNLAQTFRSWAGFPPNPKEPVSGKLAGTLRSLLGVETAGEIRSRADWVLGWRGASIRQEEAVDALAEIFGGTPVSVKDGDWTLVGSGRAGLKASRLPGLTSSQVVAWEANMADWPAEVWPRHVLAAPVIHGTSIATNGRVRTEARLRFPAALDLKLDSWQMPPMLHGPVAGLAAVRGVSPFLAKADWFKQFAGDTAPNQFMTWSVHGLGFFQYYGFPMGNSDRFVDGVADRMKPYFAPYAQTPRAEGTILHATNQHGWNLYGLPAGRPAMFSLKDGGRSWVFGGLLQGPRLTNSLPAELVGQLNAPELVAYSWEEMAEGFIHWRNVFQLWDVVVKQPLAGVSDPANALAETVTQGLRDSVTQVRRVAPNELVVTRSSELGLSGVELALTARWIDRERHLRRHRQRALGVKPPGN